MGWALLDYGVAGFSDGNGGHSYSYPGGAPAPGDLLVVAVSSDTVVSTPADWLSAVSDVGNIGTYIFYRVAGGSEPGSVVITTSGNFPTEIGYLRYGGAAATPLDVTAHAAHTVSTNSTPAATTDPLAGAGELSVAAACLGGMGGGTPSTPVWSAGYTNRLDGQTGTGNTDQHLFVADRYDAGAAAESPSCTWTSNANNQTLLIATFKPAGGHTVALGQASQTDTATPVAKAKNRTLVLPTETDTASLVAGAKSRTLGQATQIDTATAINRAKSRQLVRTIETQTALAISLPAPSVTSGTIRPRARTGARVTDRSRAGSTIRGGNR